MEDLSTFLACARGDARYESALSTSAGGSGPPGVTDVQPGSSIIEYVFHKRILKQASSALVSQADIRSFADVSHEKQEYVSAGGLKSSSERALWQNVEQLLWLWRADQEFMLGWTINPTQIFCHFLVSEAAALKLYDLNMENTPSQLLLFSQLFLAPLLTGHDQKL